MYSSEPDQAVAAPPRISSAQLDLFERLVVCGLFLGLAYRFLTNYAVDGALGGLVALAGEAMVVIFVLIRRPAKEISHDPLDWALALSATCGPLLVMPADVAPLAGPLLGLLLMLVGFSGQIWSKVHLFRSFGIAPALRAVVVKGPYRFVRHPIYASYFIFHLGVIYTFPTLWNAAILATSAGIQVFRMIAEERVLGHDAGYRAYMERVRWRILPGVF